MTDRNKRFLELEIEKKRLRNEFDFVLDPIEQIPTEYSDMAVGNWANDFLGITDNYNLIKSRATGKVAVFVFDTAGKWTHPMLKDIAWNELGKNFSTDTVLDDLHGHSTHVLGCIGAIAPDTPLGVARMLVEKGLLKGVPYKVLNGSGSGSNAGVVNGILDAIPVAKGLQAQNWKVIFNFSLGSSAVYAPLDSALAEAKKAGILVFCANGNNGGAVSHPGSSPSAQGIAALNQDGSRASFSNFGPTTYMGAPGVNILSTYKDSLASLSGTSMATPTAVGIFAILWSIYPNATPEQIIAFGAKYATDLPPTGKDDYTGYGAPKIGPYLVNTPGGVIDPPPPPPVDERRETRTIICELGEFESLWRKYSSGVLNKVKFDLTLAVTTDKYDEPAYDEAMALALKHFTNRGYVLLDKHGLADFAFYAAYFFELIEKGPKVTRIVATDEKGRVIEFTKSASATLSEPKTANRFMKPTTMLFN